MFEWIKKHKALFFIICVIVLIALIGVPFVINLLFKADTNINVFQAEWSAGDALGYYGAVLSFLGTVILGALALYQNHMIKEEADKKAALLEEKEQEGIVLTKKVYQLYYQGKCNEGIGDVIHFTGPSFAGCPYYRNP